MNLLMQTLPNGLVLGTSYAVIAVGLTLVFGILHIANFAHGAFFAIGAYAVLSAEHWGVLLSCRAAAGGRHRRRCRRSSPNMSVIRRHLSRREPSRLAHRDVRAGPGVRRRR